MPTITETIIALDEMACECAIAEIAENEETVECSHCGSEVSREDAVGACVETCGETFCSYDCAYEAGYTTCERCGCFCRVDDGVVVDGSCGAAVYCSEHCAEWDGNTECERCGTWVPDSDAYATGDGTRICDSCSDAYSYCLGCDELYHDDDLTDGCCPDCCEPRREHLHEYGYRPMTEFFGDTEGNLSPYMGVELETDSGGDRGGYCASLMDTRLSERFWLTEDSSLCNGVEVTTHPMTLSEHLGCGLWEHVRACALEHGFVSHDSGNCGIHVHINRDFFGKSDLRQRVGGYNMGILVARHERQLTAFSRRRSNNWCSYRIGNPFIGKDAHLAEAGMFSKAQAMTDNPEHSLCVNFQHGPTFEIRIFRGTLRLETLYASLALSHGLARAAKLHGQSWCEEVGWYDLVDWVLADLGHCDARGHLERYMSSKGLLRTCGDAAGSGEPEL